MHHAALRRVVRRAPGRALDALDGCDVHDRPPLVVDRILCEHLRDGVLADEERAGEVDADHAVPLGLVEQMHGPTARHARCVHDPVEASEPIDGRGDHRGDGGRRR